MRKFSLGVGLAVVPAVLGVAACGVFGSTATTASPPSGTDNGADGSAAPAPPPPPPLGGTPTTDDLTEALGVFVTPTGTPTGDGTRAHPLGSIVDGLALAQTSSKRVYVCTGTYKEALTLANGFPIIGALDCTDPTHWVTGAPRSRLESPTSPAVQARNIDKPTRFEGFAVLAPDGTDGAPSSIALIAESAGGLTVANGRFAAGKGNDGVAGTDGTQLTLGASANGQSGPDVVPPFIPNNSPGGQVTYPPGGPPGVGSCVGASGHDGENGGAGGRGGVFVCPSLPAPPAPVSEQYYQSLIGTFFYPTAGTVMSGAAGGAGADGASATVIGTLAPQGYTPADGTAGADGSPGKGGSGGNARDSIYGTVCILYNYVVEFPAGPGGGAGGCPGLTGKPGTGGGASIAALVFASVGISFDATELVASTGGAGGKGTFGSDATAGGLPGTPNQNTHDGQPGGHGGRTGVSGSGAGGPSIALAHTGGAPNLVNGTKTTPGVGGAGVPADSKPDDGLGNARTLPASAAGLAKDVYAF